jgi:hypothetical protein
MICTSSAKGLLAKESLHTEHMKSTSASVIKTQKLWKERVLYHIQWTIKQTFFFIIKPTRCTNFTNLFLHETLHVSGSSSAKSSGVYSLYTRQWYMSYRFEDSFRAGPGWNWHTGLKTAFEQDQDGTEIQVWRQLSSRTRMELTYRFEDSFRAGPGWNWHIGLKTAFEQDQDGTQFHPGPASGSFY